MGFNRINAYLATSQTLLTCKASKENKTEYQFGGGSMGGR